MEYNNDYYLQRLTSLTPREKEIAELLAWGASKKEIPDLLPCTHGRQPISVHTVDNITANIYAKLHIQKVSELCVIYFCSRFCISMNLSPIRQKIGALLLLLLLLPGILSHTNMIRPQRTSVKLAASTRISKTKNNTLYGFNC